MAVIDLAPERVQDLSANPSGELFTSVNENGLTPNFNGCNDQIRMVERVCSVHRYLSRILSVYGRFIARFFAAQRMLAMLLHDGAGKLFCWNCCVHHPHNGPPKSA